MELQVTVENRNYSSDYLNLFLQAVPTESTPEKSCYHVKYGFRLVGRSCRVKSRGGRSGPEEKLRTDQPGRIEEDKN